jgi:iron complex transport system ATP-binding protein
VVSLAVDDLRFAYGPTAVLRGVSTPSLPVGAITALVGPNAAGKTTLLKCMAGLLRYTGTILLDGQDVTRMRRDELTRRVSYLPQEVPVHAVLTAFEAVLLAKQQGFSWRVREEDLALVERTLAELDITHLAMRYLNELSGGQRQLVSIAQALIRRSEVLLLDEPTSSLDLQRQLEVLALVRRVAGERGVTTVVTLHDLNLAGRFAEHIIVLHDGQVYAAGPPDVVLTAAMLRDVYGVHGHVLADADGVPQVYAVASLRQYATEAAYQPV